MRLIPTPAFGLNLTLGIAAVLAGTGLTAPAAAQHSGSAFLAAFDTDHDGRLTHAEYDAARGARFAAMDTDGDGAIVEAEYVDEYTARLEQQLAASTDTEDRKTEERQRQTRQAHVRFGVLDADKDKTITRAEYDRVGARSFAEQDGNTDGVVTAEDARQKLARTDAG